MSFWDRLKRGVGLAEPPAPLPAPAVEPPVVMSPIAPPTEPDPLALLSEVGKLGGPDDRTILALFRSARGTVREGDAIDRLVAVENLSDELCAVVADTLIARGEPKKALAVLEGVTEQGALFLLADIHASLGDLPRAVGAIERVLAQRIDLPGAQERHRRWSEALGLGQRKAHRLDESTVLTHRSQSGPYRLVNEVARGGAGVVYDAFDDVLGRRVAFKAYHGGEKDRASIEREIRFGARARGAGVVDLYDAGIDEGWIALEWASLGSLRDLLRSGRARELLPVEKWLTPLARALGRVHSLGIVHSDIKPANVLLRSLDDPALTDFGIAKEVGERALGGSAGYMSPERLGGSTASFLDDVYGVGRIVEDVLNQVPGATTPALKELCRRCLGSPDVRPESGAAVERVLVGRA